MGLRFNDLTGTSEWQERSRWQSINRRFVTALQMDLEEAGKRLCDSRAHRIIDHVVSEYSVRPVKHLPEGPPQSEGRKRLGRRIAYCTQG